MMKRLQLATFLIGLTIGTTFATGPRKAGGTPPEGGIRLTQKQLETIRAVHPWIGENAQGRQPLSTTARFSHLPKLSPAHKGADKVNTSGSRIQGWRTTDPYAEPAATRGWYELDLDGTQRLKWEYHDPDWVDDGWTDEPDFPFTVGFWRDGKVYGFHSEMILYWLVWGHGSFTLDGQISDYTQYGDDLDLTDFSTYVLTCAYDEENDKVYAYTLNADASGYQLQTVNPDTWEFNVINDNVPIEDICVGFSYNPVDKKIYGVTPDARFITLDTTAGTLNEITKFNLPVNTSVHGMTYSPLDKEFVLVVPGSDSMSDLYTIDPENPVLEKQATLENTLQYRILITPDRLLEAGTPVAAEIISVDFSEGSTSGTASVKLPTKTFDGSAINGDLTLAAYVDGEKYSEVSGQPGAALEVKFENIEDGMRKFSFSAISGELESAMVDKSLYVGYDTPLAPGNIELKEGVLTWDAPDGTVHDGYLDSANLTYNVYLNGEQINNEPIRECSYSFTMPEEVFRKYVAQVEAVNHGHASDKGFSNDIKYGNPFPLPFTIAPTEAEGELVKIISGRNEYLAWHSTGDNVDGRYFSCSTNDYDGPRLEWLYMPAITIPESDTLLEISFDMMAGGYEENSENLSVGYANTQEPANTTIIKKWDGLKNVEWTRLTAYCLPEPGTSYIAFLTETSRDGYRVNIRNISVKISDRPVSTPAAPTGLTAEALPKGALKANVSFTMPTLNAAGGELKDKSLTVTVKTEVETKTVSGVPGSEQNVEVATMEGVNEISVIVSNENEGLEAKTSVFTGLDVPNPISEFKSGHTEDFKGIHIEWEDPTTGANGGYVDPEKVTYALCLFNEEKYQWEIAKELGNVNEFDANFEVPEGIALAQVGIVAQNEKGNCGTILTVAGTVGTPYLLPMGETFSETNTEKYYGTVNSQPDDSYSSQWGYISKAYPYWIDESSPYGLGAYCASGNEGVKARIILPAFSTTGISSPGIEIPLYAVSGKGEIKLYAKAYGIEPELIGTYTGTESPEWKKMRFHIPSKFDNQKWVEIIIDSEFFGSEQTTVAFAQYKIQTFVSEDMAVTEMTAPTFPLVGESYEITATTENAGLNTTPAPELELLVISGEKTVKTIPMTRVDGTDKLAELGEASYKADWTPDAETTGEVNLTVKVVGSDMNPANDSMTAIATVAKGKTIVVTDLNAELTGQDVTLSWTEPELEPGHESFESFAPFSYGERIGDFRFVNLDGEKTSYFGNFNFPWQIESKAWQVMSESEMTELMESTGLENNFLTAADGDKFLIAFTPFTVYVGAGLVSNRWIISPEIKEGSQFSFYLSCGVAGYLEYVDVLYSNGSDDPEDFTTLEEYRLLTPGWKKYEFTLPEDAKYFAIRYKGNSDESFFVLLDDIRYEPVEESPVIEGYDIYRDGSLVAENVKASVSGGSATYSDLFKPEDTTCYNITPVINRNGTILRGLDSNTAYVAMTGIDEIEEAVDADAEYYTLQGFRVINPDKGIYIKRKGTKASKVIIR